MKLPAVNSNKNIQSILNSDLKYVSSQHDSIFGTVKFDISSILKKKKLNANFSLGRNRSVPKLSSYKEQLDKFVHDTKSRLTQKDEDASFNLYSNNEESRPNSRLLRTRQSTSIFS